MDIGQPADLRQILGRDILDYQLDWLKTDDDITETIVLTDSVAVDLRRSGTVYHSCAELPKYDLLKSLLNDQPFLLIYGPLLTSFKPQELRAAFRAAQADIVCLTGGFFHGETFAVEQDSGHKLTSVFGSGAPVNNLCIVNPLLLTYYFHERFEMQTFLAEMLKARRRIFCLENTGWLEYVNTYPAYFQASGWLLKNAPVKGAKIHQSYYGKNCEIDFSVSLRGRQFFGDDCLIGKDSILQNSIFLDRAAVGENCRINNSILQKNVKIGRNCELKNCLLGEGVAIGDNVRLPDNTILAAGSAVKDYSGVLDV
jgi:NDP-sugar pyrophosphorylase family protein